MTPTETRPAWQRSTVRSRDSSPLPSCSLRHNVTIREFRLPNVPFRQLAPYSQIRGSKSPKWTIFVCQVAISEGGFVWYTAYLDITNHQWIERGDDDKEPR